MRLRVTGKGGLMVTRVVSSWWDEQTRNTTSECATRSLPFALSLPPVLWHTPPPRTLSPSNLAALRPIQARQKSEGGLS